MVILVKSLKKMVCDDDRPPLLDVVDDADDEDGGRDKEKQDNEQDLSFRYCESV